MDAQATTVLSNLFKMKDIMDTGIATIEKLELQRKPYPKHDALYILADESLPLLAADFAKEPMYRKINLIFINRVLKLDSIAHLISRVVQIKEFNYQCYYTEDNTFHFKQPGLAWRDTEILGATLSAMRPFSYLQVSHINCQFAQQFANDLRVRLQAWEKSGQLTAEGGELHFLILERQFDLLTPLLHDFHYESLLMDLKVEHPTVDDSVFQKYRHLHIAQALEGIPAEFQAMVQSNPSAQLHKGEFNDLDQRKMQAIMATMPTYNTQLKDFTFHMGLIDKIWQQFETRNLRDISELEQSLATGTTKAGHQTKSEQLYQEVILQLQSKIIEESDKLRLVLISLLCLQLPEGQRQKLLDKIQDHRPIQALKNLGYDVAAYSSKVTKKVDTATRELAKQKLSQMTLDLSRHTPQVEKYLNELLNGWKYNVVDVYGQITQKQQQQQSLRQAKKEVTQEQISVAVFVVGGLSYCEIDILRNYSHPRLKQLYLGGNCIMSPQEYLDQLRSLVK